MRCADDERTRRTETIYACSTHAGAVPRTRGWNEVREKGNVIGSVRRLGSLAKGRFLDSERRDRRPRERARETGRGYKRGYKREGSFVRSFALRRLRKTGRPEEEGVDCLSFSLSPPRSLFALARWATPSKEGQRSILGPTRVVTSSYATAEYEVTHARSSTIR